MKKIIILAASFFLMNVAVSVTTAQSVDSSSAPLSCVTRLYQVPKESSLPYSYNGTELSNGTKIDRSGRYVYSFDVINKTATRPIYIQKVVMQQLNQRKEPITIIDSKPSNGSCVQNEDKQVICTTNFSFHESASQPIHYLVDINATDANEIKTSTLFTVETNIGTTQCASMYFFKPTTTEKNPIHWETPYALIKASDFSIKIGDKVFRGVEPIDVHSDPATPGRNLTTLETTWKEQGVEMRMFMYFKKNDTTWNLYELRTYDGNTRGDWIYYQIDNQVESTVGLRNYNDTKKFIAKDGWPAEVTCYQCEINAFMNQVANPSEGYVLELSIGQSTDKPIVINNDPLAGYGVSATLKNKGVVVTNPSNFSFNWQVSDNSVVKMITENTYGEPQGRMSLTGIKPGEVKVFVKAIDQKGVDVATTSFSVIVKEAKKNNQNSSACISQYEAVPVNQPSTCCSGLTLVPANDDRVGIYGICAKQCFSSKDCGTDEVCGLASNDRPVCVKASRSDNTKSTEVDVLKQDLNKLKQEMLQTKQQQSIIQQMVQSIQSTIQRIINSIPFLKGRLR